MRLVAIALTWLVAGASAGSGQRLLDWPVRTSALPDAVVTGAGALFWNPAGLEVGGEHRAEALIMSLRTPDEIELSGVVLGGVTKYGRSELGIAYQHFSLGSITETASSVESGTEINLGEDHFILSAGHQASARLRVGATARYTRDNVTGTDPVVTLGAGFHWQLGGALRPRLGAFALSEGAELSWAAGAELTLPRWLGERYQLAAGYGAGESAAGFFRHQLTALAGWRDQLTVTAGVVREGDAGQATWEPTLAASLRLQRYTVGVVRESLSNGLGATYAFRLQVGFGH